MTPSAPTTAPVSGTSLDDFEAGPITPQRPLTEAELAEKKLAEKRSLTLTLIVVGVMTLILVVVMAVVSMLGNQSGVVSDTKTMNHEVIAPDWYKKIY